MPDYDKEYIIRYVDNDLSAEERARFETDLQNDAALAAELALYKELKATLEQRLPADDNLAGLRGTMQSMNAKYFGGAGMSSVPGPEASNKSARVLTGIPGVVKRVSLGSWVAGMAVAASFLVATVLLWPSEKDNYLERLGHTQMISTTERGSNADSLLQQASGYFNRREFDKALPLLDRAVKEDSSSQLALFYRGVAQWNTGATDPARRDLERVYRNGSALQYEAAFYIALSFAGQKDKVSAKEWLARIPGDAPVAEKAKELLKKLE